MKTVSKKIVRRTFLFSRTGYALWNLVLQEACIEMTEYLFPHHNHTPTFCHLFWHIWVNLKPSVIFPIISSAMFLQWCFYWQFIYFGTNLPATCLILKMLIKMCFAYIIWDINFLSSFSCSDSVINEHINFFPNL